VANPPADLFTVPVNTVLKSNYITARAASCQMLKQGSGVIMFLTRPQAATRLRVVTGDRLARQCRQRDRDTTVGPHDRYRRATPPSRAETRGRYRQVHQRDPRAGHLSTLKPLRPRAFWGEALGAVAGAAGGSDGRFSAVTVSRHAGCPISAAGDVYMGEWVTQA